MIYLFVLGLHMYKLLKPWLFLTECNTAEIKKGMAPSNTVKFHLNFNMQGINKNGLTPSWTSILKGKRISSYFF